MSNPRPQFEIEAQIKRRIIPEAPNSNDLDFYTRKARRLENENALIQDEVNKLRVRLRRAEDYQIKYDALLNDTNNLKKELDDKEKNIRDIKGLNEKLARSLEEKDSKTDTWTNQRRELLDQIQKWTRKAEESDARRIREVAAERTSGEQTLRKNVEAARKQNIEKQNELEFELKKVKRALHEKQAVQNIVSVRIEKVRKEKDEEISRLLKLVKEEKEMRHRDKTEHAEELGKLKEKFEKIVNFQLQGIKKNLQDQGEVFSIELNGLKEIIAIKNDQIVKLLQEVHTQADQYTQDRNRLLSEISILKDRVYETAREGELELDSLKEKMIQIHGADIRALEMRYDELLNSIRGDKDQLEGFLRQKDRIREKEKEDHRKQIDQLKDRIKQRDQRALQLQDHIKETGDLNTSELKNLHESFHKIQVEKENITSEYQTNITFMTQQITKLTATNDAKNAEIKRLQDQLHETKKHFEEEVKELNLRARQERKDRDEERERDRKDRDKLADRLATSEREFKANERKLTRQRDREQRQKNKMKFVVEQLQRDVTRLNQYIKGLDETLKNEYKKSQMNIIEGTGSRREVTSQLQKQKLEIETMKDIEVDQIKREYQRDIVRIQEENQKLKTDLLNKALALEKAESEVKKLDFQHRNMERINRQKMIDYEKKMATLNSEINLTQQLYQTFLEAKARKGQQ